MNEPMTLMKMRRYAIRNGIRIRFHIDPAGECLVNEHGLVKISSPGSPPNFNVSDRLGSVEHFFLDGADDSGKPQKVSREQLQALLGTAGKEPQHQEE